MLIINMLVDLMQINNFKRNSPDNILNNSQIR